MTDRSSSPSGRAGNAATRVFDDSADDLDGPLDEPHGGLATSSGALLFPAASVCRTLPPHRRPRAGQGNRLPVPLRPVRGRLSIPFLAGGVVNRVRFQMVVDDAKQKKAGILEFAGNENAESC